MLQQTQVKNVTPYYLAFIRKFPSLKSLSDSKESEVLIRWSGLGYYARARNLLRTAQIIVKNFRGEFPRNFDALNQLPGIGPYTAGAILSIAYHLPYPALDGNVRRVLSRFFLAREKKELRQIAERLVRDGCDAGGDPAEINQALMELGALVCLPRNPLCARCPVNSLCLAKKNNVQRLFPKPAAQGNVTRRQFALALLSRQIADARYQGRRRFLVQRRSENEKWLPGLWEFPMLELRRESAGSRRNRGRILSRKFSEKLGNKIEIQRELGSIQHTITQNRLHILVLEGTVPNSTGWRPIPRGRWLRKAELRNISASSILRKALALLP